MKLFVANGVPDPPPKLKLDKLVVRLCKPARGVDGATLSGGVLSAAGAKAGVKVSSTLTWLGIASSRARYPSWTRYIHLEFLVYTRRRSSEKYWGMRLE